MNKKATKNLTITLIITILLATATQAALKDGLVAYWDFNTNTSNPVDAQNSYVLQNNGSVKYVTGGYLGGAMNFSGSNWLQANATSLLNVQPNGTYCAWAKPTTTGGAWNMLMARSVDSLYFGIQDSPTPWYAAINGTSESTANAAAGTWTYACVVDNNTNWYIYTNGAQNATGATKALNNLTTAKLYIGVYNSGNVGTDNPGVLYWTGLIDSFAVWNTAKSATEIYQIYGTYANGTDPLGNVVYNFTITAQNNWNNSQINSFNITLGYNGTYTNYSTNNGTIYTTLTSNINYLLLNITNNDPRYLNVTFTAINTSSGTTQISLTDVDTTPPNITCNIQGTNQTGYSMNLSIQITEPQLSNTTITPESITSETNTTKRTNYTYGGTTYNITNITTIGNYTINITATDFNGNTANYQCNYTITPDQTYVQNIIRNYGNTTTLTNIIIWDYNLSVNTTTNPYLSSPYSYLNKTTPWYNLFLGARDQSGAHIDTNQTFNITRHSLTNYLVMNPTKVTITFKQNGTTYNTSGHIQDNITGTLREAGFQNTTIVYIQTNLANGPVKIEFGNQTGPTNYSQFYEYINDGTDYINETLNINLLSDYYIYFYITDASGQTPIKDAYIRLYSINNSATNLISADLIGQRITDNFGTTHFYVDKQTRIAYQVIANGYNTSYGALQIRDYDYNSATPLKILLQEGTTTTDYVTTILPDTINNMTNTLNGMVVEVGKDSVCYQTDYRQSLGLACRDLTCTNGQCPITTTPGQDYPTTDTGQNIIFQIYADGVWSHNATVLSRTPGYYTNAGRNQTNIFIPGEITDQTSKSYLNPLLLILAIIITFTSQLLIKTPSQGVVPFKIAIIILAIISSPYWWAAGFIIVGEGLKQVKKIISE